MNLPLPKILTESDLKSAAAYIFVPEYKSPVVLPRAPLRIVTIGANGRGRSDAQNWIPDHNALIYDVNNETHRFAATGTTLIHDEPICLKITNRNSYATPVEISPDHFAVPNFGNPSEIIIESETQNSYSQILNILSHSMFPLGSIRLRVLDGDPKFLNGFDITYSETGADGRIQNRTYMFHLTSFQFQNDIIQLALSARFFGGIGKAFKFSLPGSMSILLEMFPVASQPFEPIY